jgi:hypothetical protein
MSTQTVRRTPAQVAQALQDWLKVVGTAWPPAMVAAKEGAPCTGMVTAPGAIPDAATAAFCRQRIAALAEPAVLAAKLRHDLGDPLQSAWRPLGHVLAVVTEEDHLGVIATMVAAALTGNRLTLKARHNLAALLSLREALGWGEAECRIDDWPSQTQDDAHLLQGVQGIVLAGSEALIRHYRSAARPGVRLIEYGPRISAALLTHWPASAEAQARCVAALVHDTGLFMQGVCSAPQWVLVPDADAAQQLFDALAARLDAMPPLPEADRLMNWRVAQEMTLEQRLGAPSQVAWCAQSGWGVSLTDWDMAWRWPRGFRVLVGGLERLEGLAPALQTLGVWPDAANVRPHSSAFHCCTLGRMHERPLLAPHDGQWELAQWVNFVSSDAAVALAEGGAP